MSSPAQPDINAMLRQRQIMQQLQNTTGSVQMPPATQQFNDTGGGTQTTATGLPNTDPTTGLPMPIMRGRRPAATPPAQPVSSGGTAASGPLGAAAGAVSKVPIIGRSLAAPIQGIQNIGHALGGKPTMPPVQTPQSLQYPTLGAAQLGNAPPATTGGGVMMNPDGSFGVGQPQPAVQPPMEEPNLMGPAGIRRPLNGGGYDPGNL